jgi:hypothetical protein
MKLPPVFDKHKLSAQSIQLGATRKANAFGIRGSKKGFSGCAMGPEKRDLPLFRPEI